MLPSTLAKKLLLLLSLVAVVLFLIFWKQTFRSYKTTTAKLGNQTFTLFITDTEEKRIKGLSGASSLGPNEGMLFQFEKPSFWSFWMKEMQFPIDVIYINGDKVIDIVHNLQPETYPNTVTSRSPADKVIEIGAGRAADVGLESGDIIEFR